jgi:uncharacterized protein YndB with AHSA1/START domain
MYTVHAEIMVHVLKEKVWEAFTVRSLTEQYFFGTKVTSDWQPGGSIVWTGVWEGEEYKELRSHKGICQLLS